MEIRVGGKFRLVGRLGSGSFGAVYVGANISTGEKVAIKIESLRCKHPQLLYEAKLCKNLSGGVGIPNVHWYGIEGDFNVMVIDLLGPTLHDLHQSCDNKFSLNTVLKLADQMMNRVEYLHAKNLIHRDIKPHNFCIGLGRSANLVHVIDFGLAKKYRDSKTLQHIPYREHRPLTGTAIFASVNAHVGIEQSRRDDLESVGYVLVHFVTGTLPWQDLQGSTRHEKLERIMDKKISTPVEALCKNLPGEFMTYMNYCRSLRFEDRPDYAYLRGLLRDLFSNGSYQHDFAYDWTTLTDRSIDDGDPEVDSSGPEEKRPEQKLVVSVA